MRGIVVGCVLCVIVLGLTWLFAGRRVSMALDHLATIPTSSLPTGPVIYNSGSLRIGDALLGVGAEYNITVDGERVLLSKAGRSFSLGTLADGSRVLPDPGDQIVFTINRAALSWPTPFEMNFMTGHSPSWKRHLYYRLGWTKKSGEKLEMVWRYEQWFYASDGWVGGFMTSSDSTGLLRVSW